MEVVVAAVSVFLTVVVTAVGIACYKIWQRRKTHRTTTLHQQPTDIEMQIPSQEFQPEIPRSSINQSINQERSALPSYAAGTRQSELSRQGAVSKPQGTTRSKGTTRSQAMSRPTGASTQGEISSMDKSRALRTPKTLPSQTFSIDQDELSSRLSQVVEANELPKVLTRSPKVAQVDSAFDSMTAQETNSRPRHGSLATPYTDHLFPSQNRSRTATGFSTIIATPHGSMASPSVHHRPTQGRARGYTNQVTTPRRVPVSEHHGNDDSTIDDTILQKIPVISPVRVKAAGTTGRRVPVPEPHYNYDSTIDDSILQKIPVMGPTRVEAAGTTGRQPPVSEHQRNDDSTIKADSFLQSMPVIEPQRSGTADTTRHNRVAEPQDEEDSSFIFSHLQHLPVMEPGSDESIYKAPRQQKYRPRGDELYLPDVGQHTFDLHPPSQEQKKCPECNHTFANHRSYHLHSCCGACKDVFPNNELYRAHFEGKKHQAKKLHYEYCHLCEYGTMNLDDHTKERSHKKAVKMFEAVSGTRFVFGGGNFSYGCPNPIGEDFGPKRSLRDRLSITSIASSSSSSEARAHTFAQMDSMGARARQHRQSRSFGTLVPTIIERTQSDPSFRNSGAIQTTHSVIYPRPQNPRFATMPFNHFPVRPSDPIEDEGPSRQVTDKNNSFYGSIRPGVSKHDFEIGLRRNSSDISLSIFQDPSLNRSFTPKEPPPENELTKSRYDEYRSAQELSSLKNFEARSRSRAQSMTRENQGRSSSRETHAEMYSSRNTSARSLLPRPSMPKKEHSYPDLIKNSPHEIMLEVIREKKENTLPDPRAYMKNPKGLPNPLTYSRNKLPPIPSSPTPSSQLGVPNRHEHPDPVAKKIEEDFFREKERREWGGVMTKHPIVAEQAARARSRSRSRTRSRASEEHTADDIEEPVPAIPTRRH